MSIGYVTLEESDVYIDTFYTSTDPVRVRWEALSEGDRTIFLLRSFGAIESLHLRGIKTDPGQLTQFPRYPEIEVSSDVKYAQIDNAAFLADTELVDEEAFYGRLAKYGVTSFNIGDTSEKLSGVLGSSRDSALVSKRATRYLQRYLTGGYGISRGRCHL